ncbi:SIR2 family NAD-dependent protein deacylase [Sulfurirhabdus autotrophica]|uniref:protein acetyllysine N-acetyltransferase n=1 Tax=Sulfurirhabdus autotrophica TaxID=1706046 RepID=A0A4R3XR51_9PROT|nr:Sir2 family NAD-dependent protein deacetylase [Sulfurirhabdus autotrophica]TCV81271.1 NAD-dependent SIR2 family protein deacetylase [Sulfurirhabdus autotrophica]
MIVDNRFAQCADQIEQADSLIITAGAGMGVDSGLPDFRGAEGFWQAYPALGKAGIQFHEIANPSAFRSNPQLAWGFYGHRLNLYRDTVPHEGFSILLRLGESMPKGMFVFTSNVDAQFQKAGFSNRQIHECHGSIHHLQCQDGCMADIWSAEDFHPLIDQENCLLTSDFPRCPHCGEIARPNILMFNDRDWLSYRADTQESNLKVWLSSINRPVIIEIGAGESIPTVRRFSENQNGFMVRINPKETERNSATYMGFKMDGLAALQGIEAVLQPISGLPVVS